MKTARIVASSLASLGRHKLRTFFMTLATLIGVTALTVVVAYGQGTRNAVLDNFDRLFGGSTIMLTAGGASRGGPHGGGPVTTLTLEDLEAIERAVPEVEMYDPLAMIGERDVVYEGRGMPLNVVGHSETHESVWDRGVTSGTYFGLGDVQRRERVAVVGERVVEELFEGADPSGRLIRIDDVPFEVIGVLEPMGIDPHGIDLDREIHVPVTTAMRRLANIDYIGSAKLGVREDADLDQVVLRIADLLRPRHALAKAEPNDFSMFTPVQVQGVIRSSHRVFTLLLPLIAGISLLVGGVVVANLMLMSVNERRAEIGLRKAVGAKGRDISLQFLLESVAVTGAGGLLALGFGLGVLRAIGGVSSVAGEMRVDDAGEAAQVALGLPWEVALLGIGTAIAVGVLAGVVPARRAAALDPVETLR